MKNKQYEYYEVGFYETLPSFLEYISNKYSDGIAFKYSISKKNVEKTYNDFVDEIKSLGRELLYLKYFNKNIGVLGENSYNWVVAYMAASVSGNVVVPIDKELSIEEIENIIREANIELLFISNTYDDYFGRLKNSFEDLKIISFKDIEICINRGKDLKIDLPSVNPDDLSTIIFTSGTTSKPKGVMLTHKNLAEDARMCQMQFALTGDSVLVLPLHHTFSFTANILFALTQGYAICIPSSLKRIDETLKKYKPSSMILVPMLVEAFYSKIWKVIKETNKNTLVSIMIAISNILLAIGIDIRAKVFKQIINNLGGNLNLIISGGAALEPKYVKVFRDFGINIYNGYGITECSPVVSVNRNNYFRDGSVGTPLPGVDVKIERFGDKEEGEVLVKGDIVMKGYYNNTDLTSEVMTEEGYFRTGDIGYLDKDNFLFITGRMKNVIILDNGKNIYPEELEGKLQISNEIKEVVVFEKDKKITAEIYPDFEVIPSGTDAKEFVQKIVDDFNKKLPYYKKIEEIIIRDKEFEKTTSKKIKRSYANVREDN